MRTDTSIAVTLTYDRSKVSDQDPLAKVRFPLVPESALEDSLGNLASAGLRLSRPLRPTDVRA
jgi:hypothetical protein